MNEIRGYPAIAIYAVFFLLGWYLMQHKSVEQKIFGIVLIGLMLAGLLGVLPK